MTKSRSKKTGKTIDTIKGSFCNWEVYSYVDKGKTLYGTRLIAKNGNILAISEGFVRKLNADNNILNIVSSICGDNLS